MPRPIRTEDCPSEAALTAYAGDGLEPAERRAVETHVATCAACAATVGLRTTGVDEHLAGLMESALAPTLLVVSQLTASPTSPGSPRGEVEDDVELEPGARVQRYDIRARLGAGAMGTVYEAHDPDLDRLVALKLLKTRAWGGSAGEAMRDRLLREARAMARLAHPNVVTVFEVGTLRARLFVAMELVRGTTLRRWLAEKPRSPREVLAAYTSAGLGLAAAHDAGLVHRDFKPDNVLRGEDGRVRVTDFGLARTRADAVAVAVTPSPSAPSLPRASDSAPSDKLTKSGVIVGTPAYMAPEQFLGAETDARSDIFAFSVALFEGLYGVRPFTGKTVTELMTNIREGRVREAPRGTRVPSAVRKVLLRGLGESPGSRAASMHVLLAELARAERGSRVSRWGVAGAAVLVVALVAAVFVMTRPRRFVRPDGPRPVVAVLEFHPRAGDGADDAWLGGAVARVVSAEMTAGEKARAISPDDLARRGFTAPPLVNGTLDAAALARMKGDLGAGYVVVGTYETDGANEGRKVRIDARVIDTATGKALRETREDGKLADARALSLAAADDLDEGLGLRDLSNEERAAVRATLPANPDALRLYIGGLDRALKFDALGARAKLEQAVAAEPNAPMPHAELARTLSELGYDDLARNEAKLALDHSAELARADRLSNEALVHELASEWDKAAEIQRALFTFFPDDVEYGLRLANALQRAGKAEEAKSLVDGLRNLSLATSDRVRIDVADLRVCRDVGDFARVIADEEDAVAGAAALGSLELRAQALHAQAFSLMQQHQSAEAVSTATEARRLFSLAGDDGRAALAEQLLGEFAADSGDLDGAEQRLLDALATARRLGALRAIGAALSDLVTVQKREEHYEAARELFDERARIAFAESPQARTIANFNYANILFDLGDLTAARVKEAEVLDVRRAANDTRGIAFSLTATSEVQLAQGEFDGAQKSLDEARNLDIKDEKVRDFIALELAWLALDRGQPASDLNSVVAACDSFHTGKRFGDEALCRGLQARLLFATGKRADALALLDASAPLLTAGADLRNARLFGIDDAYIRGMLGPTDARVAAIARLDAFIARAHEVGCIGDELDARLARSLVEIAAGRAPRESLASIAKDATARGYLTIAAHANARRR